MTRNDQTRVRRAAVAGSFYPGDPAVLRDTVDALLAAAQPPASVAAPKALIVPHAGYVYSGPIAATAYATLRPIAERLRRVVILGPAHRVYIRGCAIPDAEAMETPIGALAIDARNCDVPRNAAVHAQEHSIEVQLPFLQRLLPTFAVVPIVVGDCPPDEVAKLLGALWGGPETLVLISSDLSHYLPARSARAIDAETAARVVRLDVAGMEHERACGATPIAGLLTYARTRHLRAELLDLRNSGDTAGGADRVVGYGAFAFHEPAIG